jgi:ABC-2 type transport system ATP-binding protein
VRTDGLTKRYGDVTAVDDVSLRVGAGEVYALLGLNGAGKSTTIRLLLGMVQPSAGSAEALGVRVHTGASDVWRRVGHLVESAVAYPELTVRENVRVAALLHDVHDARAV